jgi:hypothetical protein
MTAFEGHHDDGSDDFGNFADLTVTVLCHVIPSQSDRRLIDNCESGGQEIRVATEIQGSSPLRRRATHDLDNLLGDRRLPHAVQVKRQ